jgi:hypothetical protein
MLFIFSGLIFITLVIVSLHVKLAENLSLDRPKNFCKMRKSRIQGPLILVAGAGSHTIHYYTAIESAKMVLLACKLLICVLIVSIEVVELLADSRRQTPSSILTYVA